ncbi:MAG: hypothetical protein GVY22_16295 [Gammaproteobacteria bacterium]|nr:hypothetical protein [Gammaproteobacteria bacterium]
MAYLKICRPSLAASWPSTTLFVLVVAILLTLLAGDTLFAADTTSTGSDHQEQQPSLQRLKDRAEARWAALSKRDFAKAYAYETPGYRSTASLEQFESQYGSAVRWLGANVSEVELAKGDARAKVKVQLDYEAPDALGQVYTGKRSLLERWIVSEGEWWYVRD